MAQQRVMSQSVKEDTVRSAEKNIKLPKFKLLAEDSFKKETECFVCRIPFGHIKDRQHHCRCCGNSTCSSCSNCTINDARVCDICFYKAQNMTQEKKRRRYLKAMKEHIQKMNQFTSAGQRKIKELDLEYITEKERLKEELTKLQQEYDNLILSETLQKDEKQKQQDQVKQLTLLLEQKVVLRDSLNAKGKQLDEQISTLDTEYHLKEVKFQEKNENLENLKKCLAELEASDSFLNLSLYQEASKIDSTNISSKIIAMSANRNTAIGNRMENFQSFGGNVQESKRSDNCTQRANQLYEQSASTEEEPMKRPTNKKGLGKSDDGGCKDGCLMF